MKCQECGTEIRPGSRFCSHCGAQAPAPTAQGGVQDADDYIPDAGTRIDLPDAMVTHTGTASSGLKYQLIGTTMQAVTIQLRPGETVYSESGGMSWMSANIKMNTTTGGGVGRMLGRMFSGESLFLVDYTCTSGNGIVAFSSEFPGKVIPMDLAAGQSVIAQKDAFMCAEKSVEMTIQFRKRLGAGFFGGEGFIMQKLTGPGMCFVELDGEIVEQTLAPNQTLLVDTGYVAMYEPSVDFDIEMVRGIKNVFFGGEGLFLARLRGPGRVWLQTMPMYNLARKVATFVNRDSGGSTGGNIAGQVVKGLLNN